MPTRSAGSETGGAALGPRIGAGAVPAVDAFDRVRDSRTVTMRRDHVDLVAAPAQIFDPRRIEVVLDRDAPVSGSMVKRGALIAACGSSPSTSMRVSSCRCVCACPWPPSLPNTSHGRPSRSASAGISVCSGIFRGPITFGWPVVEVEGRAAVVEVDPPLVDPQPAAGAEEVRLDQAHQQPVAIGGVHIDRAARRA